MKPQAFRLDPAHPHYNVHRRSFVDALETRVSQGPVNVMLTDVKRTREQNDKLHPMVRDIARQVLWSRNGLPPARLSEETWRYFFAAHVVEDADTMPKIDGDGVVVVGVGTSSLSKRQARAMVDLMYAFGNERGVIWSEPPPKDPADE